MSGPTLSVAAPQHSEEVIARLARRQEAQRAFQHHLLWKRTTFQPRAPLQHVQRHTRHRVVTHKAVGSVLQKLLESHSASTRSDGATATQSEQLVAPDTDQVFASREQTLSVVEPAEVDPLSSFVARKQAEFTAWDPLTDLNAQSDPQKTLFVGRLGANTSESQLKEWALRFGRVVGVSIVRNREGNSRGYGFVEFARSKEVQNAIREGRSVKLDGRSLVLDVERGRTSRRGDNYLPRRFRDFASLVNNKRPREQAEVRE